ncbi:unnamed protein product [Phytophthora lilii]|uniref:Unnamed protein product n=1 Tax=Phytophthora lilii TaxID=2077276 RepID=A0A9W6X5V3_9STRA|nr:unnamed protein product [Phytophthora lilii]
MLSLLRTPTTLVRLITRHGDVAVDIDEQEHLLNTIERNLKPEEAEKLDEDLTAAKFDRAIESMKSHSAPGPDGFTADFFKLDSATFGAILLEVFRYQQERGIMLPHQRYSSVALLFKKGDRSHPGNFRPITLMPVEVKILSEVLVKRLRSSITFLVHADQKGFIPGRLIH